MSSSPNTNCFGFVVDTNLYAGNFEREMCAYMTGCVGECEVGDKYAALFFEDMKLDAEEQDLSENEVFLCQQIPDDHGCHRPVSIYGNCNSLVIYFENKPTEEQIKILKERAYKFNDAYKKIYVEWHKEDVKVLGFKLVEYKSTETIIAI